METLNGYVVNLANSIIGASILAMPYCFKQCGIILSVLLLLISSIVSRLSCHFLLKSAILSRRKTFDLLAFHLFGGLGKLIIEVGMIGFLLGTCITYFVVMGDLGPVIITDITNVNISNTMRTSILMSLALFIILPLGLLRNVHSLTSVSKATMIFYCCLILKIIIEALPRIFEENWFYKVNLWRPEGLLQCIPIFSMALFCQTQLFEIYQVVPNPTLDKMNNVIKTAVNFCTSVYICVGTFGYIAFANKNFTGNVLLTFEPSFISNIIKIGFIFSVAFSFPLVIFPCRASIYSLLYREGYTIHEGNLNYIPEGKFKTITFIIVFVSLIIAILIPNIELVLGLVGSTIGIMVCVLFPVTCFICISQKNTNERIIAQIMLALGVFVMVVGTYKNIQQVDYIETPLITPISIKEIDPSMDKIQTIVKKLPLTEKLEVRTESLKKLQTDTSVNKEIRHEPPQPIESLEEPQKLAKKLSLENKVNKIESVKYQNIVNDTVDIEAIKKEDKEEQLVEKQIKIDQENQEKDEHKKLIDTIQKQNEVQKEIVEQQKQLLEVIKQQKKEDVKKMDEVKQEKMKAVKEIESIALKAIEKISEGEDSKKVVDDLVKDLKKNELTSDKGTNLEEQKEINLNQNSNKSQNNNNKAKEFEKKVDSLKNEIKEFNSQLNQAELNVKHSESVPKVNIESEVQVKEIPILDKNIDSNIEIKPKIENLNLNKSEVFDSDKKKINDNFMEKNNNSKVLPIPLIMSNNLLSKNDTKSVSPLLEITNQVKEEIKKTQEDVQAMRRDILSLSTEN